MEEPKDDERDDLPKDEDLEPLLPKEEEEPKDFLPKDEEESKEDFPPRDVDGEEKDLFLMLLPNDPEDVLGLLKVEEELPKEEERGAEGIELLLPNDPRDADGLVGVELLPHED